MDNASNFETFFSELREKLIEGLADAGQGKLSDGEAFFDELDKQDDALRSNEFKIDRERT